MMDYPCGKFCSYSFSRFGSIMRTDTHRQTHTHTQTRMNALLPRLSSAWVMIEMILPLSSCTLFSATWRHVCRQSIKALLTYFCLLIAKVLLITSFHECYPIFYAILNLNRLQFCRLSSHCSITVRLHHIIHNRLNRKLYIEHSLACLQSMTEPDWKPIQMTARTNNQSTLLTETNCSWSSCTHSEASQSWATK